MTDSPISTTREGDLLIVTSNNPPVNALGAAVRTGLTAALDEAEGDDSIKALVLRCEGRTFFAGADITEFGKPPVEPLLPAVIERMEAFGKPIVAFPRVADKLAMMAVETMAARQLTYFAAREKDQGRRCDLEAGMAKLLAARVAWSAADNSLQIHGGNGFALEYDISRVLCDARILNIFEGAGEIQAQVIARRLLDKAN